MPGKKLVDGSAYTSIPGKPMVGGTVYTVKEGKTMVDGTAYSIKFEKGTPLSEYSVGSIVKLNVSGTAKEFIVVHQGLPSSIYDDSCNGTWLLMKDIYESRAWHSSNVNDYENSTIHSYLNSTFLALFDSNIQSVIKQVKIPYRAGSGSKNTVTSGASGLQAKIFLLSCEEIDYGGNYTPKEEGSTLSYFYRSANNSSKHIAYLNGSASGWWLRSPYCFTLFGKRTAWRVNSSGEHDISDCSSSDGIRPALVLPSTLFVSDDLLIA